MYGQLLMKFAFEFMILRRQGGMFLHFWSGERPENLLFYNRDYLNEYLGANNNQKNSVPGHGHFSKLEQLESIHCEKRELYM